MELFDIDRKEEEENPVEPTLPQMKFLHILAQGRLVVRKWPTPGFELRDKSGPDFSWKFNPKVAANVVLRGWADMEAFDGRKAEYRISSEGKMMLKEFCAHNSKLESASEILAGQLICRQCGRSIRCRSKQPTPHAANRWHWRYRAICQKCWDFLAS